MSRETRAARHPEYGKMSGTRHERDVRDKKKKIAVGVYWNIM